MAKVLCDGSTVTFNSVLMDARSVEFGDEGGAVQVTTLSDTMHRYLASTPDPKITFEVLGKPSVVRGDKGNCTIAWNDGTNEDTIYMVITSRKTSGRVGAEITTSITLQPAPPA